LAAVVLAIAILLVGVGAIAGGFVLLPYHSPGSKSVSLTVAARTGPGASGDTILVAPSLNELTTLVEALRGPQPCPRGTCWPGTTVSDSSLLIAMPTPAPCRESVLSADLSPGNVLQVHVVAGRWECPPGGGALAAPTFWLLTVPGDALPSKALTVVVDERDPGLPPQSSIRWTTIVDLRPPGQPSSGAITSEELQSTIGAARRDEEGRQQFGGRILELGLFRWHPGAAMCTTPTDDATDESWGSFVVIADYTTALEYHSLGGATVFCRSRSL
jgi:hypothetical protein